MQTSTAIVGISVAAPQNAETHVPQDEAIPLLSTSLKSSCYPDPYASVSIAPLFLRARNWK